MDPKICMETKRFWNSQNKHEKKNSAGGLTLTGFRTHYKDTITKAV